MTSVEFFIDFFQCKCVLKIVIKCDRKNSAFPFLKIFCLICSSTLLLRRPGQIEQTIFNEKVKNFSLKMTSKTISWRFWIFFFPTINFDPLVPGPGQMTHTSYFWFVPSLLMFGLQDYIFKEICSLQLKCLFISNLLCKFSLVKIWW